ncbi:hypothetical protein INT43_005461 [Umbelopsis isabellina]|uniref:Cullin family profile domain-containing protein n=1 Tax=Mortierella isabellina TaxID=91625 RepID=A0A8H7UC83_MORIS|nr:hypothetical protein INT43_005461 [Umbelopsis isabellina]
MQNTEYASIWDLGLQILRKELTAEHNVLEKITNAFLELVSVERLEYLRYVAFSPLCYLGIYTEILEPAILNETRVYYTSAANKKIASLSGTAFLAWAVQILKDEGEDRVRRYIDKSSQQKLVKIIENSIIKEHVDFMIAKGFRPAMATGNNQDLGTTYELCKRVDQLRKLCSAFSSYVKESGLVIIHEMSDNHNTVINVLSLKKKMDQLVKQGFCNDQLFLDALKDSFTSFLNFQPNKAAEIIARFVDSKLRNSSKQKDSADDLDELFDRILIIFRYVQGKDMFDAFFKRDLAKRLLLGRSMSIDTERMILAKLKLECGPSFTSKSEGMLKDMEASKKLMKEFKAEHAADNFNVSILTQGYWPVYPQTPLNLPAEVLQWQESFHQFYNNKFNGRRLRWQSSLGHCLLKANFPLGQREISLSHFQAAVLLLFNDSSEISFTELLNQTEMEESELKKTIQSLCFGPHKILSKMPEEPTIQSSDRFCVNDKFEAATYRLKVSSLMAKEPVETNSAISKQVMQNRQYQIDAAIVRIMKARKEISHQQLCEEVQSQLNFPAGPADLKKRIESLTSRYVLIYPKHLLMSL